MSHATLDRPDDVIMGWDRRIVLGQSGFFLARRRGRDLDRTLRAAYPASAQHRFVKVQPAARKDRWSADHGTAVLRGGDPDRSSAACAWQASAEPSPSILKRTLGEVTRKLRQVWSLRNDRNEARLRRCESVSRAPVRSAAPKSSFQWSATG
jgi:hypothetical protein